MDELSFEAGEPVSTPLVAAVADLAAHRAERVRDATKIRIPVGAAAAPTAARAVAAVAAPAP